MWTQIIFVICQCCTLFIRKISDYDRAGFRAFQVFVPIEPFSPNIRLDTTNSMDCKIEKSGSRKQAFHFHFVPLRFGKKKHKLHSPGAEPNFNIACFECRVKCFLQCKQIYVYVHTHTHKSISRRYCAIHWHWHYRFVFVFKRFSDFTMVRQMWCYMTYYKFFRRFMAWTWGHLSIFRFWNMYALNVRRAAFSMNVRSCLYILPFNF